MPVNNFQQARIDMSKAQAKAVGELLMNTMGASVSLEETNIANCVAVIKVGKASSAVTLVHHGGEVYRISGSPTAAEHKQRAKQGRAR